MDYLYLFKLDIGLEHLQLYNEFNEILSKLRFYKDYEYLKKRTLKYFSSLCDYHVREVLNDAKKVIKKIYEKYTDAPLFWIILQLDKYQTYLFDNNEEFYIYNYLTITEFHTHQKVEQENYYLIDFNEEVDNNLKQIFKNIKFDIEGNKRLIILKKRKNTFIL